MHGQSILEDLTKDNIILLLHEHWLTPANLNKFDKYFPV